MEADYLATCVQFDNDNEQESGAAFVVAELSIWKFEVQRLLKLRVLFWSR